MRMLLPSPLIAALGSEVEPGHRSATISFVRLSGSDALLDKGVDVLANALDISIGLVEDSLAAEGLTLLAVDVERDGAKCFCAAGAPVGTEDDEGRMLRALRRIVSAELPLQVQAGVNRGHVFVAEIGSHGRAAYSAMGDTTNTAARIAAKAPPGGLYAHGAVLERARIRYEADAVGPFEFKGKREPLVVYDVGRATGPREDTDQHRLPMLGRSNEVDVVMAAIGRVRSGSGGVLTISGAAGLGKTRLAREAVNSTELPMIVARAEPYGATASFRPLRDPLRRLLGVERGSASAMAAALIAGIERLAPDLRPFAPLFGDVSHVELPSTPEVDAIVTEHRPNRTADLVIDLLGLIYRGPLIIGVEDAQWADEATAHILGRIVGATIDRPWLVVVLRRDGEGGFVPDGGERIDVAPLSDQVIRRLAIAATEATPLRPHEIDRIVTQAAGSPQFVEEWARAALVAGSFDAVPDSINAVISAQVDALSSLARRALGTAAVLGRSFRRSVLDAVLAAEDRELDEPTWEELDRLLEPDSDTRLRFRNGLVRDVVYEALPYKTRARIHQLAGETIERVSADLTVDAEVLAEHFWRAGDDERTWRYSVDAADRARTVYANADAAMHLDRALEVARRIDRVTDEERYVRLLQLGEVREHAGLLDGALEAYRRASRLLRGHDPKRAELALRRAHTYERAGASSLALRDANRGRALAQTFADVGARQLAADCLAFAALVRQRQERVGAALALAEQAEAESSRCGAVAAHARACSVISWAAMRRGHDDAEAWELRALELFQEAGDLVGHANAANNLGIHAYYDGRWTETVEMYRRSRDTCARLGDVIDAALSDANIGEVLVNQGRLDEAEPILRDARRVLRASGFRNGAAFVEMHLGRLLMQRSELAGAESLLRGACEEYRALRQGGAVYEASLHLAECVCRSGRAAGALEILRDIVGSTRDDVSILDAALARIVAVALLALDRPSEAASELEQGVAFARSRHLEYELALMLGLVEGVSVLVETGSDEPPAAESVRLLEKLGVTAPPLGAHRHYL